ncbi:uncharacterized protein LOC119369367 [Jatropha curcas]|uniref:uncharacterized protein LOC119369367 n=1 Tax=Jatropha curcas TaxID=180498 RepID=UPI0018947F47|nr:uncharacterized protein LOC119369367 [Jatropha curcas]
MTCVYGFLEHHRKPDTWTLLKTLASQHNLPWLLMGDFNNLLADDEKIGGHPYELRNHEGFREVLEVCRVSDLGMVGYPFTWRSGRGRNKIEERLDQMVASDTWPRFFPNATVHNLISGTSDHSPLLLLLGTDLRTKRHISFMFENAWIGEPNLDETVTHNWARGAHGDVMGKLQACRSGLRIWGRDLHSIWDSRGDWKEELRDMHIVFLEYFTTLFMATPIQSSPVLEHVNSRVSETDNDNLMAPFLDDEFRSVKFWSVVGSDVTTSCKRWIAHGSFPNLVNETTLVLIPKIDKPEFVEDLWPISLCNVLYKIVAKFFRPRRWRPPLKAAVAEPRDMRNVFLEYFTTLFTATPVQSSPVLEHVDSWVTESDNDNLMAPFLDEEFRSAIFQMHPDKSPGPDGFNPCFFQKFWSVVGSDVTTSCKRWITHGSFPNLVNETNIVLIPKIDKPEFVKDLRPISLCNVLYKIVAKVLANRMKHVLRKIVSPSMSAFVPGRLITDNVILAFETIHSMKTVGGVKNKQRL